MADKTRLSLGAAKKKIVIPRIKRPRVDLKSVLDDQALYKQVEYCHAIKRARCML